MEPCISRVTHCQSDDGFLTWELLMRTGILSIRLLFRLVAGSMCRWLTSRSSGGDRILKHCFWPGLKMDVAQFSRTCQVAGKLNQKVPPAPLHPTPFEHVIVDCVGPLKDENQFLMTVICVATCFPGAKPLRKMMTPVVIKVLVKFFTTFGLPHALQTVRGTNFFYQKFLERLFSL